MTGATPFPGEPGKRRTHPRLAFSRSPRKTFAVIDLSINLAGLKLANPTLTCSGTCGHYTQIVWRTSLHVGCALVTCGSLTYKSVILCNYGPGGNSGGAPY